MLINNEENKTVIVIQCKSKLLAPLRMIQKYLNSEENGLDVCGAGD